MLAGRGTEGGSMSETSTAGTPAATRLAVQVRDLRVHYPLRRSLWGRPVDWFRAVDGVNLDIAKGETLGLVGESGCGKSTLGRALLALRPVAGGSVRVLDEPVLELNAFELKAMRRRMQLVFQDPYASLNPRETVGSAVRAGLDIHGIGAPAERAARVSEMLERVGLRADMAHRYPHEFSGGQRQRIVIARALIVQPQLLVCDEPVSALDVSVQAQILNLLKSLQREMGLTCLFISHNLAVVEHMADRVAVMYRGRIVEVASRADLFSRPRHPYTQALLAAVPSLDPQDRGQAIPLVGDASGPAHMDGGCRFRNRCPQAAARCAQEEPTLTERTPGHRVACWMANGTT